MIVVHKYICSFCDAVEKITIPLSDPYATHVDLQRGMPDGWAFISPVTIVCPKHGIVVKIRTPDGVRMQSVKLGQDMV